MGYAERVTGGWDDTASNEDVTSSNECLVAKEDMPADVTGTLQDATRARLYRE